MVFIYYLNFHVSEIFVQDKEERDKQVPVNKGAQVEQEPSSHHQEPLNTEEIIELQDLRLVNELGNISSQSFSQSVGDWVSECVINKIYGGGFGYGGYGKGYWGYGEDATKCFM